MALAIAWLQWETRCFTRFSVWSVFAILLILHHGTTTPIDRLVSYAVDGMRLSDRASRRWITSLVVMFLGLPAAACLVNRTVGPRWVAFRERARQPELGDGRVPVFVVIAAFVCLLAALVQFQLTEWGFSAADLLLGRLTADEYARARDLVGLSQDIAGSPLKHLLRIVFWGVLPPVLCISVCYASRGSRIALALGGALALAFGTEGLMSGQKQPMLFMLVAIWFAWRLGRGDRTFPLTRPGTVLVALGGVFAVIPFLYNLQYPGLSYMTRVLAGLYRLTSETNRALIYYFEFYPERFGFLHGASSGLIAQLFGLTQGAGNPERAVPVYMLGADYLNTWNVAYVGYAWADFGMAGVILETLALGAALQLVHLWFEGGELGPLHAGTLAGLAMAAARFAEVSFTATLLTFGFGVTLVLYGFLGLARLPARTAAAHATPSP